MKAGIHPELRDVTIKCACGATFTTRSTREDYHVDVCSQCHSFYTGQQRLVDTAGNIEKFNRKFGSLSDFANKSKKKKN